MSTRAIAENMERTKRKIDKEQGDFSSPEIAYLK